MKILVRDLGSAGVDRLQRSVDAAFQDAHLFLSERDDNILEDARATDPDVIVLGVARGWDACHSICRRLKAADGAPDVPVLVLASPECNTEGRLAALDAGADGFLSTQFDIPELVAQIRTMAKLKGIPFAGGAYRRSVGGSHTCTGN
ncbi:MAG: hypothetical protein R2873_25015 [Caldilineaceae bacterium]